MVVNLSILLVIDLFIILLSILSLFKAFIGFISVLLSMLILIPNIGSLTDTLMLPFTIAASLISVIFLLIGIKIGGRD